MALRWSGNGRGTAVLLHGMMSLAGTWWRIGPALAERGWDVTALDLAAHGGHRPAGPLTADALVGSVTDQVTGPVDLLVGHSMGAATAVSAAVRHPGLARALVLEDPPGGMSRGSEQLARGVELDAELARRDRERLVRRSRSDHPGWAPSDVEHDVVGIEQADAAAVAAGLRAGLRGWDMPALVGAADVPVLVLAAPAGSSALAGDARDGVRAALPADRFVELPGGHCLHRDLPDRWLAAVDAFTAAVLPVSG
ncbi:MAG TPA: alpha/beta hydrolase [Mycobacteriales bacterium]|nr:alpha/beta hydrolase [Mycobacteriales bacterium]